MNIVCQLVKFGSKEQIESIQLRSTILREPLGLNFTQDELVLEFNDFHFVAGINGKIVAVLILVELPDKILKMRQVAVDLSFQGKGIGQTLVKYSEQWARENNFDLIVLNARKSAVPFYLKLNYEIVGEEFMEIGIPHYKMKKLLI